MAKTKTTKRALLMSGLALLLCVSMLIGSTYAWFTDSVSSAGNIIQSGTLDVDLVDANGKSMAGEVIEFKTADNRAQDQILWEPGCTYETKPVYVVNKGNLALKYQLVINGIDGDAKLLEAIEWTVTVGNITTALADLKGELLAGEKTDAIVLSGHMKEEAGNEYQNLTVEGISIAVLATQHTYEKDSFSDQYDALATYMNKNAKGEWEIENLGQLIYFAKTVNEGEGYEGETVVLTNDIDLSGINWTPIGNADADVFVGFKGTFDGQNNTISNLTINSKSWGKGFFGYMDASTKATVKNLKFNNANITASDCSGIVVGYAINGTFENIHVTGDVSVVGTSKGPEAGHIGGIAGCGYHAGFKNCSVVANAGSKITSGDAFVGGIVGFQCNNQKVIADCKVENLTITGPKAVGGIAGVIQTGPNFVFTNNSVKNVVLNKTDKNSNPSIGALVGNYDGTAETTLTGEVSNVTLNGYGKAYSAYNVLYGSNYSGATTPNFDVSGVTVNGITNNLVEVAMVNNAADLKAKLADGKNVVLGADISATNVITLADIPDGVSASLDLNGHNITASLNGSDGWSQIFRVGKGASLTVDGEGDVHAVSYPTTTYGSVIFNNCAGTLVINGGTYTMEYGTYGEGYLLPAIVDTNSNVGKATTTINGGTFYHNRNMFRNFAQPKRGENNATLIINGGTFNGEADDYATIWNQKTSNQGVLGDGIVELNGGTFNYMDITNDFQDDTCIKINSSITNVTINH